MQNIQPNEKQTLSTSTESTVVKALSEEYASKNFDAYFHSQRSEMLQYVPKETSVLLEVGCADGSFGELLKIDRDIEVWGIEPSEHVAKVAAKKLDKVICAAFEESLSLPQKYFDCIVFNDVLEHLIDPYVALDYCKLLLKETGVVVASIPNVRYFDNIWDLLVHKDWKYSDWGILDKTHLRFFTRRSMIETFEDAGYCVELVEGLHSLENNHSRHSRKFKILNFLMGGNIEDMRYLQFAITASSKIS